MILCISFNNEQGQCPDLPSSLYLDGFTIRILGLAPVICFLSLICIFLVCWSAILLRMWWLKTVNKPFPSACTDHKKHGENRADSDWITKKKKNHLNNYLKRFCVSCPLCIFSFSSFVWNIYRNISRTHSISAVLQLCPLIQL